MDNEFDTNLGMSRRTLLKRGAVVGGTLAWAAPAVQSFAKPAFAQAASPTCTVIVCFNGTPVARCEAAPQCCQCLAAPPPGGCGAVCNFTNCQPPPPGASCS